MFQCFDFKISIPLLVKVVCSQLIFFTVVKFWASKNSSQQLSLSSFTIPGKSTALNQGCIFNLVISKHKARSWEMRDFIISFTIMSGVLWGKNQFPSVWDTQNPSEHSSSRLCSSQDFMSRGLRTYAHTWSPWDLKSLSPAPNTDVALWSSVGPRVHGGRGCLEVVSCVISYVAWTLSPCVSLPLPCKFNLIVFMHFPTYPFPCDFAKTTASLRKWNAVLRERKALLFDCWL